MLACPTPPCSVAWFQTKLLNVSVSATPLPSDPAPAADAVTVVTAPVDEAVTGTPVAVPSAATAVAKFTAIDLKEMLAPVASETAKKPVAELRSAPPASGLVTVKPVRPSVIVMLFPADPAAVAVNVTTAPVELAVTPAGPPPDTTTAARAAASSVSLLSILNWFPVTVAFTPPESVAPDTATPLVAFCVSVVALPTVPQVLAVSVTTPAVFAAVTVVAAVFVLT